MRRATDRPTCWRCCTCSAGTCAAWTCRSSSCGGRLCAGLRCRMQRFPGLSCATPRLTRLLISPGRWPSAVLGSTGQRAAGGGKHACGAKKGGACTWPGRRIPTRCAPSPSARMEARWLLGAGMVLSNYGTSRAAPCSGRAGSPTTSNAWPLLQMDARSPAVEMMPSSRSGTRHPARTARRSPVRAARCSRWPGVPMGACSPLGALMKAFGCGSSRGRSQKAPGGCSQGIQTGCWDWPFHLMAHSWPAEAGIPP